MARVLVVEDTPEQALMVAGLVEEEGHTVETASDGKKGLEAVAKNPPDVVVTDLKMPVLDGLGLVEALAKSDPRLPVILMTAYGSGEIAMKALRKGAASYVPKRLLQDTLIDTLDQVLELARTEQAREWALTTLVDAELSFELRNDPETVPMMVNYIQEAVATRQTRLTENQVMQVGLALQEALYNAIHHGNLAISSEIREKSMAAYLDQIKARQRDPAYASKRVYLTARVTRDDLTLVVRDEGDGFDISSVPDPTDPENLLRASGRGLYLIGTFMDEMVHNDVGNVVTMIKRLPPNDDGAVREAKEA